MRHLTPRGSLPIAQPTHLTMRAARARAEARRRRWHKAIANLVTAAALAVTAVTLQTF